MGKRGPRPLPGKIKERRGTLRPSRESPCEPAGTPGLPPCPGELSDAERATWQEMGERLLAMGVLHREHVDGLLLLVRAKLRYEALVAEVAALGEVLTDDRGNLYRNPYAISMERALVEFRRLLAEFGCTPSSATRVRADRADAAARPPGTPAFGVVGRAS